MSDQPTKDDIHNAAHKWAGEKDRETSLDDIRYFQNNWDALPGLGKYVTTETLTRRLAEVTAERDAAVAGLVKINAATNEYVMWTAVKEAEFTTRAETAEAALSRRDEALRVAREAIDEIARQMTAAEATVLVPDGEPDFKGGYDRCVARARDIIATIDALTKPQEDGQ
jgi:hypothetical protein